MFIGRATPRLLSKVSGSDEEMYQAPFYQMMPAGVPTYSTVRGSSADNVALHKYTWGVLDLSVSDRSAIYHHHARIG